MTDKEDVERALADIGRKQTRNVMLSTTGALLALIITLGGYFYATAGIAGVAPNVDVVVGIAVAFQLVMALNGIANNLALANAYRALKLRRAAAPRDDSAP